jgi:2-oxoglutarate ferredoxin oxidoreductase subunit gamma
VAVAALLAVEGIRNARRFMSALRSAARIKPIILNQPSLAKFESKVKPGGVLIYDGYGIINPPTRKDIHVYRIDAMDEANERKMAKTFNMIVLGGLLKIRPIVSIESVVKALRKTLPERHHHLIPMNEEAIRIGMDIIKEV